MDPNTNTEAGQGAELALEALRAASSIVEAPDGRRWLVLGENVSAEEISDPNGLKPLPDHTRQAVTVQTLDSLIEYVTRFRTEDTLLFADMALNKIVGAIDYH